MGGTGGQCEEFKLEENDDDQVDLLNEAGGLADLKYAIPRSKIIKCLK